MIVVCLKTWGAGRTAGQEIKTQVTHGRHSSFITQEIHVSEELLHHYQFDLRQPVSNQKNHLHF